MRYLLVLLGLMVTGTAQAIDCQKVPDCTELGYSQTENENCAEGGYIYCPFDKSYKKCVNMDCEKLGFTKEDKTSWCGKIVSCRADKTYTACKALCEVGDVFYADGTCGYAEDYDKSKVPAGIVFYVTDSGRHGKVIALHDLNGDDNSNFNPADPFSGKPLFYGLGGLSSSAQNEFAAAQDLITALQSHDPSAFDGQKNTETLINTKPTNTNCTNGSYKPQSLDYNKYCQATLALATRAFYPINVKPSNPITGQGKWYLPSVGELVLLWSTDLSKLQSDGKSDYTISNQATPDVQQKVERALQTLGSKGAWSPTLQASGSHHATSNLQKNSRNLVVNIGGNGNITMDATASSHRGARPILEF